MLSRVANAVYWMSRYIERAENIARFVDVNLWVSWGRSVRSAGKAWMVGSRELGYIPGHW